MASSQSSVKLFSDLLIQEWDHDPGSTNAKLVGPDGGTTIRYIDMRDYSRFAVLATPTAGTTCSITKLEIVGSADTTFGSVTVIKDSGTIAADALGDYAIQECTAEEVADVGARAGVDLRYVAGRLTQGGNADNEAVVIYLARPRWPHSGLSATTIA